MNNFFCKKATIKSKDTDLISSGNFIPDHFHRIITTESGKPHYLAIELLALITYLYKPSKFGFDKKFSGDILSLKYSDLENRFNKSHESIRRAFVKLESLGLIKRSYKKIYTKNTICSNVLCVEFFQKEFDYLLQKTMRKKITKSVENTNIESTIRTPKNYANIHKNEDSYPQKRGYVYRKNKESNNIAISYKLSLFNFSLNFITKSEENIEKSHIELTYNSDNNLDKETLYLANNQEITKEEKVKKLKENNNQFNPDSCKLKLLSDILPLDNNFFDLIREKVGKNLPNSYFENTIITFISKDEEKFNTTKNLLKWSKKQLFMRLVAWASKELKTENEILLEYGEIKENIVNNQTKIKSNEMEVKKIISTYKNSQDLSLIGRFKKNIAINLSEEIAGFLLLNAIFFINLTEKKVICKIISNNPQKTKFLYTEDKLDDLKKKNLENLLQDNIKNLFDGAGEVAIICDLSSSFKEYLNKVQPNHENSNYRKIQERLLHKYGSNLYKIWFQDIIFKERLDQNKKELYVYCVDDFKSSWIKTNYQIDIEEIIKQEVEALDFIQFTTEKKYLELQNL